MAEDWDLYAVVRSCTNSAAASTASSTMNTTNPIITPAVQNTNQEPGESFVTDSFRNGDIPSDFPGFVHRRQDSFQGLEEIYQEQRENTRPYTINNISPLSHQHNHSDSILQEFQNQQQYTQHAEQLLLYPQDMTQPHHQQQHLHMIRHHGILGSSALAFPSTTSPQPIRPRRRKNQQAKMIHRMTQDELSADSWAWRKYGQKPIKGSPYPRNYYRCSTSKGCTARRQVERCPTDPNMYVVSYSGEHSHPRPTHRSSLAGSTRNKVIPAATKTSTSSEPIINTALTTNSMASSSSPVSASSVSPRHQNAAEENVEEGADAENHNVEILFGEEEEEGEGWDDDDDDDDGDGDILVPNTLIDHY